MKRSFYLLAHDPDPQIARVSNYQLNGFDDTSLLLGETLKVDPSVVDLWVDDVLEMPDYLNNPLSWRLFSNRLKEALEPLSAKKDVFKPIEVRGEASGDVYNYWVGAFTTKQSGMDREQSIYRERESGRIVSLSNLAISESAIQDDVHIFLLEEFTPYLVVDEEVVSRVSAGEFTGHQFVKCLVT